MRLDKVQNPPLKPTLNAFLLNRTTQNLLPISQASFARNQTHLRALSAFFGGVDGGNFGFLSGDFVELFIRLKDFHVGFAISNHQQAYQAYELCKTLCKITPIIPSQSEGIITSLPKCDIYLLPYINQDLLTKNPIPYLKSLALAQNPQARFVIDISYALQRGEELEFDLSDGDSIFLCDGESLGFLRGCGVFLGSPQAHSFFAPTRYIDGFYQALLHEIQALRSIPKLPNQNFAFFEQLHHILGKDLDLFAPIQHCLPNTLPLRFRGIKARTLLQSLYLDHLFAINGQACLFGFLTPSFVLQEMGYPTSCARELLSISFESIQPAIIQTLAEHYRRIKTMEI